jgi:hypothetical protein
MADEQKPPVGLDLDFGTPAPAADDPLASLAVDLATQIEADVTRKRERETARQVELIRERGPQLEVSAPDAATLEVDLLASTIDFEPAADVTVTRRVIRNEVRPRSPLLRKLDRVAAPLSRFLSLGPDPDRLRRVALGLAARAGTLVAVTGLVVTLIAGAPGSAYDRTYAPEAALVRYSGGLAPVLAATEGGAGDLGLGSLTDETAAGLLIKARDLLDRFDAAAASGDADALADAFATPEAAAPWVAGALRLHEAGLRRTYRVVDPRSDRGAWDPSGTTIVTISFGGPMHLVDLRADGSEADRRVVRGLQLRFERSGAGWQLVEAAFSA